MKRVAKIEMEKLRILYRSESVYIKIYMRDTERTELRSLLTWLHRHRRSHAANPMGTLSTLSRVYAVRSGLMAHWCTQSTKSNQNVTRPFKDGSQVILTFTSNESGYPHFNTSSIITNTLMITPSQIQFFLLQKLQKKRK